MQKVWELYAIATTIINKLCKNKCYHLGINVIEACYDYIRKRLENNQFQALEKYDPTKGAKEETYLYMLVSSRIIDYFNSSQYKRELSNEASISNSYTVEDEPNDDNQILDNFIAELSFKEQTYLQYRYNDELSFKEIGEILGVTHKQASKKIENIQIKLRKKLKKSNYSREDIL